jgi:hypothetical protein
MRMLKVLAAGTCLLFVTASVASAQVQLSLADGRVTVVATNATVRQILAEWARVGQTKIVNAERIPGGALTLQLTNVSEQEALDILLRSVTGYMAAPRPVPDPSLSRYDRIMVLPTAATARPPVSAAPAPVFQQPVRPRFEAQQDDDQPSIVQPPRGPLFPTFTPPTQQGNVPPGQAGTPGVVPLPLVIEDQNGVTTTPAVGAPADRPGVFVPPPGGTAVGAPRPGMIVQPPVQPGPIVAPGQQPAPPPDN